jgi:hypothetical protein
MDDDSSTLPVPVAGGGRVSTVGARGARPEGAALDEGRDRVVAKI